MTNKKYIAMMLALGFMSIMVVYSSFISLYPFKTLEVKSVMVHSPIKAGGLLTYTVDYCKYTDKPAIVYRTLHAVDESQIIPFPSVATISVKGCHVTDVPLQTFTTIPPGQYYLLVNAVFDISAQRKIDVTFKTNNFEIIK